jgi:hypothetical protein
MSQELRLISIEEYIRHAERQIDQIRTRVIFDEKISQSLNRIPSGLARVKPAYRKS